MNDLGRVQATQKSGSEAFRDGQGSRDFALRDFWAWNQSDLLSNLCRAAFAEFIVARALSADTSTVRDEWGTYDLRAASGLKVEVKTSGFLQSWHQNSLSEPSFSIRPARAWHPDKNTFGSDVRRHADVYVFALLAHKDKATVDPMDLSQWRFYVVSTATLNSAKPKAKTLSLSALEGLAGPVSFDEVASAVEASIARRAA
ncbi:hypothetical protein [Engelhardtia mirabilis]|uniref:Uncharacterized protein n=1 Tax=Engelhardtia mirabilis TaxID=2528011 RepID=A0A518BER8_9BACT|nr:hypothetical protein Pla133_05210 [Planctomycetes bacterium Pla133]QDU99782.1 hypothetical protein Pla86_05210 [Planctomycetes bacterium Pla86]